MTIEEYVAKRKLDLDKFETYFKNENKHDPKNWPLENCEEDWLDQEELFNIANVVESKNDPLWIKENNECESSFS